MLCCQTRLWRHTQIHGKHRVQAPGETTEEQGGRVHRATTGVIIINISSRITPSLRSVYTHLGPDISCTKLQGLTCQLARSQPHPLPVNTFIARLLRPMLFFLGTSRRLYYDLRSTRRNLEGIGSHQNVTLADSVSNHVPRRKGALHKPPIVMEVGTDTHGGPGNRGTHAKPLPGCEKSRGMNAAAFLSALSQD